jgi:N-carbamoylputrescine amidase
MSRTLTVASIQFTPSDDMQDNIDRVAGFIREAAGQGADVVLPPELFCGYYFCKTQEEHHFARALPWQDHPAVVQLVNSRRNSASSYPSRSTRRTVRTITIRSS